jgi:hypothetical protein
MKKTNKKQIPKVRMPKYSKGGKFGKGLKDTGLFLADTALAEWAPNAISQDQYSDSPYGKNLGKVASIHESFDSQSPIRKNVSKYWTDNKSSGMNEEEQSLFNSVQPIAKTGSKIGEMWTGSALGGIGAGAGSKATGFGKNLGKVSEMGTKDYNPNVYNENQVQNQAQIESQNQTAMSGLNDARRNSMTPNGNMYAKYGGQMKFAMGGMNMQPNAEVENNEMITSNTPPQVFNNGGVELASNNPYGTPTYKTNGASHENGGIPMNMAPGSIINGKTRNPLTGNKFTKDVDIIAKMENKYTKKAESGDRYSNTNAKLILPILAQKKDYLNNLQNAIIVNNEQRKALNRGELPQPSMDNQQIPPQGEIPMAKHGGIMNYMAMGGVQLPYYNTDSNGNPKYGMGGFNDEEPLTSATTSTVIPTDFKTQSAFDTYMKSNVDYAPNPQTLGKNTTYYPKNKYLYDKDTNIWSNTDGTPVPFNSPLSSDLIGFTPKNTATSTSTANWQTNQLLRGGGNKLTFPGGATQIVAPKEVVKTTGYKYGGKMPKYALGGEEDDTTPVGNIPTNFNYERNKTFNKEQNQRNLAFNQMTGNTNPGYSTYNSDYEKALQQTRDEVNAQQNKTNFPEEEELSLNNAAIDKAHGWNHKDITTRPGYKKETNPLNNIDWSKTDKLGNLVNFLGQNAGNIYDLTRKNEPLQSYERTTGKYITPDFRDANQKYLWAKKALANVSGGNARTALANIQQAHVNNVMNTAQIQQAADNTNAQIGNQVNQFNTEIAYREAEARAKDAAMKENVRSQAAHNFAESTGKLSLSNKQDLSDKNKLDLYNQYYNTPEFKAFMKKTTWGSKKSTKKSGK